MKIVVSDVHRYLKRRDTNNREHFIGSTITEAFTIGVSAHGDGSVYARSDTMGFMAGIYVTCVGDDGQAL